MIYAVPAAWQSVSGGKRRFLDRIDWEFVYFASQILVWGGMSGHYASTYSTDAHIGLVSAVFLSEQADDL